MTNHRTRWTQEETAFLLENWDGHKGTAEIIAELLDRTPNAVSQRYYEIMWGTAADAVQKKPEPGETHANSVAAYSRPDDLTVNTPVCPSCYTVLPVTLHCDNCD